MLRKLLAVSLVLGLMPAASHAASMTSYGFRAGVSITPDQLVLGGQLGITDVAPHLTLVPNLELGIGDGHTVIAMNVDMQYHFAIQGTDWAPYGGLGIGINNIQTDLPAPFRDQSDTEIGLNIILGTDVPAGQGNAFFAEARIGVGDIPELKLVGGMNFRMR